MRESIAATPSMSPVADLPAEACRSLLGVLTDIDDTITTRGRLPASAYAMLERLSDSGMLVIPVTGRPAGWCDMIARFWPVAAVVGENGALAMRYDRGERRMRRIFAMEAGEREENAKKLSALAQAILEEAPGAALAADQPYRQFDLAIDHCEDVPALPRSEVRRIAERFRAEGATAKVSSIHVNGWFGEWDKLSMTAKLLRREFGVDLEAQKERFVFCGDSPNDAPMFAFFPNACAVANVADFAAEMEALPAFVSRERGAEGFVEIGEAILAARDARTPKPKREGGHPQWRP